MAIPKSEVGCSLSEAYLSAVSTLSDIPIEITGRLVDNAGIDSILVFNEIVSEDAKRILFSIFVQLKHSSQELKFKNGKCKYQIETSLYNKFRSQRVSGFCLLIILFLPHTDDIKKWIQITPSQLCIKGTAYFVSLQNAPPVPNPNQKTIGITVGKSNRLTVESLRKLATMYSLNESIIDYEE